MLSQVHKVDGYTLTETTTIRTQDRRRFLVEKPNRKNHYVVTFQTRFQFGCSCPAGRNQKHCKHVNMCLQKYS